MNLKSSSMADLKLQDLYSCNGCNDEIPTNRARIACHTCSDYHLCANCFVIKRFSRPHVESHSTMVLKLSGIVVLTPPGFAPRAAPALPPRQKSQQSVRVSEMPTANWGALWNVIKAPLEKMDKKNRKSSVDVKDDEFKNVDVRGRSASTMSGGLDDKGKENEHESEKGSNSPCSPLSQNPVNTLPPSPPKSFCQGIDRVDSSAPSYPRPAKWEPLFEVDGTPTPIFVALMSTLFSDLDPNHTGSLRPETYSAFLDIQGCDLDLNSWKRTLGNDDGESSKGIADLELGLYFSENNISHNLKVRTKIHNDDEPSQLPTSAVGKRIRQSISFKPNMPMLSRQGFIDLTNFEYHKDLDKAHECLKRATKEYGIWHELGEIPRDVLPDQSKSTTSEAAVEAVVEGAKARVAEGKDLNMPPPPLPIRTRGGGKKVEAWMTGEKLDEGESSKSVPETEAPVVIDEDETEEKGGVDAIHPVVTESKPKEEGPEDSKSNDSAVDVDDSKKPKENGKTKVEEEETKEEKMEEWDGDWSGGQDDGKSSTKADEVDQRKSKTEVEEHELYKAD